MISLICQKCESSFDTHKAWTRNGRSGKFCSKSCAVSSRSKVKVPNSGLIEKNCLACSSSFTVVYKSGRERSYCSQKCRRAKPRLMPFGENHPNWKGGISERTHEVRVAAREAKKKRPFCEECGNTTNLQAHHIKSHSSFPELRSDPHNFAVLCSYCHAKEHPSLAGMISVPRVRIGITISCMVCNKDRYIPKHLMSKAKYCSKECQRTALHISLRGRKRIKLNEMKEAA